VAAIIALDKDLLQLELVTFLLKQEGHQVHATPEPETALDVMRSKFIDLVALEVVLQRHDGFKVCQQIRSYNPHIPLMIVSQVGDEEHLVRGLLVADDYVVKPFSPRVFLARVHALLRRGSLDRTNSRWLNENLQTGEISLNLQQMHAIVNGHRVPLTPRELTLLHTLMLNPGRVLSRDQLMHLAWGDNFVGTSKTVDVYIQRLRVKMTPCLTNSDPIEALRGFGYRFNVQRAKLAGQSVTESGNPVIKHPESFEPVGDSTDEHAMAARGVPESIKAVALAASAE
jgi:DNA-binding response OmpR family regulator